MSLQYLVKDSAIILTNPVAAGTQVTIIKRQGTAWDSTINIQDDTTKIARFLKAEPGIWYTEIKSSWFAR